VDEQLARRFPPTRHSAVEAIRAGDATARARALATLSSVYWRPVYGYLRLRWGRTHDDACDLSQEFFAEVVEKELIERFDPGRARLRTWLRACIDGMVANHDRSLRRQKRGPGAPPAVEDLREEIERLPAADTPETLFEKQWARSVFALALRRLQQELAAAGKESHHALLEACDLADPRPTYAELAVRFGISVTDVTNRLFRTRRELRRCVLDVLRELTADDAEFREEARALLGRERE